MAVKTHKKKKSKNMRGKKQGTHGWGARKKHKKSGHKGGKGMSGTGKRADQKKTLVLKLYGHGYFGKKGITSHSQAKDKTLKINLQTISDNLEGFVKKGIAKKTSSGYEVDLSGYKILGRGESAKGLVIICESASGSVIEKVKKKGGEIRLQKNIAKQKKKSEKTE